METPMVGMRMGVEHEDRLITEDLRTCFGRSCLFRATVKRVYQN
jgi:DNA-binding XRE family transcriptional regulator